MTSGTLHASEYWQQQVNYSLDVTLDIKAHTITGHERLKYYNHSPDTLYKVYFHLYQNAYTKGSYLDMEYRQRGSQRIQQLSPAEEAGITIHSLSGPSDNALSYSIDNTILRINLPEPIAPGDSTEFRIAFTTRFGNINRRMKREGNTYTAAHWYPRIAVYDQRRGWNNDQHLGSEFYGDFGTFDLTISAPAHFIIGATGELKNRGEVLPDSLMHRLDIRNFRYKPWGEPASTIIKPTTEIKTWQYHAENVHDVAWVASPDFRIGRVEWNGIQVYAFAKESHAAGWQDAASFTAQLLEHFSNRLGMYEYPKMIVADVNSGMEYPMLTADGGKSPTYYGLLAHEVAHNWFYGMLGTNETYRAMMDEGFTNFIASNAIDELVGGTTYWDSTGNWYQRMFYPEYSRKYYRNDLRYMRMAHTGYLVNPLATHSDKFNEYREYRQVYYKTAEMLYNLEYVLGDSLFDQVMCRYVQTWKFKHPYPEDFIQIVEEEADADFNWFFDEWIYGTSTIDYAVERKTNKPLDSGYFQTTVRLERKNDMAMPIDLAVHLTNGDVQKYTIPVNGEFTKQEAGYKIAAPWFGWEQINPTYTLTDTLPARAEIVQIDPSGRLADVYRLDNSSGLGVPIDWHFDNMYNTTPTLDAYDIWVRPSFLYNSIDGPKTGIHWRSSYLESPFLAFYSLEGGIWYGTLSEKIGYQVKYETPMKSLGRLTKLFLSSQSIEGREWYSIGLSGEVRDKLYARPFTHYQVKLHQHMVTEQKYVPKQLHWERDLQRFVSSEINHGFASRYGRYNLIFRSETDIFASDFQYSVADIQLRFDGKVFNVFPGKVRLYGMAGNGNIPAQRSVYIAGGSPADAAESNWLYRSRGSMPVGWVENNHIGFGGGLNLRGYLRQNFSVKRGLAVNVEFELPNPINWALRKLITTNWYVFADGGYFNFDPDITGWNSISDTGLGLTISMKKIPSSLGDYTIRLDFPVWKSNPGTGESQLQMRWLFAFGRSW